MDAVPNSKKMKCPHETSHSPDRLDAQVWATVELLPELAAKAGTKIQLLTSG